MPVEPASRSPTDKGGHPQVFNLRELRMRMMDDDGLVRTVITFFLEDTPKQVEILTSLLKDSDAEGVIRTAHSIKGASASAGGEAISEVAYSMELAARAGDLAAVGEKMPVLEKAFEDYVSAAAEITAALSE